MSLPGGGGGGLTRPLKSCCMTQNFSEHRDGDALLSMMHKCLYTERNLGVRCDVVSFGMISKQEYKSQGNTGACMSGSQECCLVCVHAHV